MARRFSTTRWTLVSAARAADQEEARQALASLCEMYWYPVYAFIRRDHPDADARDLTQGFFARVIEKGTFHHARADRGRFRTFLLSAVRHFLANEREAQHAQKRGGGQKFLSLEFDDGNRRYSVERADDETPERTFERKWALEVLAHAMAAVRAEHAEPDRLALFDALRPFLTGDEPAGYRELAGQLNTTEGALRVAVHRLRRQFGEAVRATIADTVERPEDVDGELRHLLQVVSR